MEERGGAPRPHTVAEMANILLAARAIEPVGKCWVINYIACTSALKSTFPRKHSYQRAQQEDPRTLRRWFERVEWAYTTYGILPEDIFNIDESG